MSPFLTPARWQEAIAAHPDLLVIDRFICSMLWDERNHDGVVQVRQTKMAKSAGISSRHLRNRIAELERRGLIQRLGSDNDGTTFALVGGTISEAENIPEGGGVQTSAPHQGRIQKSGGKAVLASKSAPRADAQFCPPEEYKNITLTLEPKTGKVVPAPTILKSPPSPLLAPPNATNGADLLGLPLADDEDALLREAIETWQHWQAKLGKKRRNISLTPKRRRRFAALFRGPLGRSMTAWRMVCQRCTRNALLAGVEGRWDGAGFDWVMLEDNAARILRGDFPQDFDAATVVTA